MEIYWIVIGILILGAFILLRFVHGMKKMKIVLLILIAGLLYISISGVFSTRDVSLDSPRGVVNGIYVYFGWLGQTAGNLWDVGVDTVRVVGNAVKINNTEQTPKR